MPLSYGAANGSPATGVTRRSGARRWPRSRRFETGGFLFLATIGILGAASTGGLLAAGFALLLHPQSVAVAVPSAHPPTAARAARLPSPAGIKHAALAPAAAAPAAGTPPAADTAPTAKGPSPAARFATQEGDARFAVGDAVGARFFYEQAVDAGDAVAAVRMGETFDRAFLTFGRLRYARANPAAARFWYSRAVALGDPDARIWLDYLATEPADGRAASRPHWRLRRRYYRPRTPPEMTFHDILQRFLHLGG